MATMCGRVCEWPQVSSVVIDALLGIVFYCDLSDTSLAVIDLDREQQAVDVISLSIDHRCIFSQHAKLATV